jgi:hypothetical protein
MNKKFIFSVMLVCLLAFCLALVSCGGDRSKLTGVWEEKEGSIELFKDGTANLDGASGPWTIENNRIMFTVMGQAVSMDYKLSGKTLTLTYDGETVTYTKK